MLFVIEDNEYAISVPVEVGTAGGNISKLVQRLPELSFCRVRRHRSAGQLRGAQESCRLHSRRQGPAFVHGHVIRPYSHSLSDDEKLYRPDTERQQEVERDPITRFQLFLVREGILDEKGIDELEKDVEAEVQDASDRAVAGGFAGARLIQALRVLARPRSHIVGLPD